MLRVLIADDHEIVRRGIREIVETQPAWEVCAEASTGGEVLEMALQTRPDVVILDMSLPELSGVIVARQLKQALPLTEILFFTMHDDEEAISRALGTGARGYLLKTEADAQLVAAVSALAAHQPYFSSCVSEVLLDAVAHVRKKSPLESFTLRELEVGQLIAEGQSNKMISRQLNLSVKTIETHRASAMRKAGVRSAPEFVAFAIKHNLIRP